MCQSYRVRVRTTYRTASVLLKESLEIRYTHLFHLKVRPLGTLTSRGATSAFTRYHIMLLCTMYVPRTLHAAGCVCVLHIKLCTYLCGRIYSYPWTTQGPRTDSIWQLVALTTHAWKIRSSFVRRYSHAMHPGISTVSYLLPEARHYTIEY